MSAGLFLATVVVATVFLIPVFLIPVFLAPVFLARTRIDASKKWFASSGGRARFRA